MLTWSNTVTTLLSSITWCHSFTFRSFWNYITALSWLMNFLTVLPVGLSLTGYTAACSGMFMENSWSRSMRNTWLSEVRQHTCCCINPLLSVSRFLKMESMADRLSSWGKNGFHYKLYCLVGFVLVSITDVMKLVDDNQWETESAPTAVGTRVISAQWATGTKTNLYPFPLLSWYSPMGERKYLRALINFLHFFFIITHIIILVQLDVRLY